MDLICEQASSAAVLGTDPVAQGVAAQAASLSVTGQPAVGGTPFSDASAPAIQYLFTGQAINTVAAPVS